MPIKLNVGLAQKVGEPHYGSRGASVNLEIELDSSLAGEPDKLRDRIKQMFALVRTSLNDELKGVPQPTLPTPANLPAPHTNGKSNGRAPSIRTATPPQIKKLQSLAQEQHLDLDTLLRERCQVQRAEDLTLRQASDLIDSLKAPFQPQAA